MLTRKNKGNTGNDELQENTQGMGTARRADTLTKTNRTHGTAYTQTGRRAISEVETDGENEATPELNHRRWEKGRKTKSKAQGTMDYQNKAGSESTWKTDKGINLIQET